MEEEQETSLVLNKDAERQKKVQAGKEKLAHYLKKKHKQETHSETKKKKQKKDPSIESQQEITADKLLNEENFQSGINLLKETSETNQIIDIDASEDIEPLQVIMSSETNQEISPLKENDLKSKFEECNKKIEEYRSALNHRDSIISQLTTSLKTTIDQREKLQTEAVTQAEGLASEVNILKLQLQQASELLRNQKGKNEVSAELLDAKNKIIILENKDKEKENSIHHLTNENQMLLDTKHTLELQLDSLQAEVDEIVKIEESKNNLETIPDLGKCRELENENENLKEQIKMKTEECSRLNQIIQEFKEVQTELETESCRSSTECELENKKLNSILSSLKEEKYKLSLDIEKSNKQNEDLHLQLQNMIQRHDFMKIDLQKEIEHLNSCLYASRRDADSFKNYHFSEMKRIQHSHLEELEQMRRNSEECYKQTVGELNSKLKQMHNELLNLKSTATELELCKQKHSIESEQIHNNYQRRLNEYECKMAKIMHEYANKETDIKKLELKLESLSNAVVHCSECEVLREKLHQVQNEFKDKKSLNQMDCTESSHVDWDIAINLGDVTKEILQLRSENEKLKSLINCSSSNATDFYLEQSSNSDHKLNKTEVKSDILNEKQCNLSNGQDSDDVWKRRYDDLLREKFILESRLFENDHDKKVISDNIDNQKLYLNLAENDESFTNSDNFEMNCLQEKLKTELALREKLLYLLKQQEFCKEKYMNDINSLEITKHSLEVELQKALSNYQNLLVDKQKIEKELCDLKLDMKPPSNSLLKEAKSDLQQYVEQITQLEKAIVVLKLRLQHETELKNTMNSMLLYMDKKCKKYEQQVSVLKNEVLSLQDQLETSIQQQETYLKLAISEKDDVKVKLGYERTLNALQQQLIQNISEKDCENIKADETLTDVNETNLDDSKQCAPELSEIPDVHEAISIENSLLKESLENEKLKSEHYRKELENTGLSPLEIDHQIEMMEVQFKLQLVMENNKSILKEKSELLNHLNEQGNLISLLQQNFNESQSSFPQNCDALMEQINLVHLLQKELLQHLQDQQEKEFQVFNILEGKNVFQETLRQEKEILLEKMKEKEILENHLLQQKIELERLSHEKHHLKELIKEKERLENELINQKQLLEKNLSIFEHHLQERENILCKERAQLQMELHRKDLVIRKWQSDYKEKQVEYDHLHYCLKAEQDVAIAALHQRFQQESLHRIEEIRNEMDHSHTVAIARLQQDLQKQFAVRENELVIKYSSEICVLQDQHKEQIKLLNADYTSKLDDLLRNSTILSDVNKEVVPSEGTITVKELEKLRFSLSEVEMEFFDKIHFAVEKYYKEEYNNLKEKMQSELKDFLRNQKEDLELKYKNEVVALEAKAENFKNVELAQVQENLTKLHKQQMNEVIQSHKFKIRQLENSYEARVLKILGLEEVSSESLFHLLYQEVINEFRQSVKNLNLHWESKYLDELAVLRQEIEEKFKQIASEEKDVPQKESLEAGSVPGTESIEAEVQLEKLDGKREELIKRIEEMRDTLEQVCSSEVNILKEHLKEEFDSMKELQNKMKTDLTNNQSPVLVELHKIKEEYEILQEKYEEIIKEQVEIEEFVIKKAEPVSNEQAKVTDKDITGSENIETELSKLKQKLEAKHSEEMEQLRKYFENQCNNMEQRYMEEINSIKASQQSSRDTDVSVISQFPRLPTLTHFCDAYNLDSNIMDVEEHYKKEMEEKLEHYRLQLEDVRKTLELKHSSALATLEKEYHLKLLDEIERVKVDLEKKYSSQTEDLLAKHNEELRELQRKCLDKNSDEKFHAHKEYSREILEEIEKECNKLHGKLKTEHQHNLECLQKELELKHKREIEIIQARLEAEKAEEINRAILKLRHSLQQQRHEIESDMSISNEEIVIDELSEIASSTALSKAQVKEEWKLELEKEVNRENKEHFKSLQAELQSTKELLEKAVSEKDSENQKHLCERENLLSKIKHLTQEMELLQQTINSHHETQECGIQAVDECDKNSEDEKTNVLSQKSSVSAKEHDIAVETLKEQFFIEIKNLQLEHNENIKKLEHDLKEMLQENLLKKEKELTERYTEEMERLKQHHLEELNEERLRLQEDLTTDHITKFEAVTHAIDSSHQLELEELRQNFLREHDETVQQLQHDLLVKEKEFQVLLEEMKEGHEKDIEDLKDSHAKNLINEMRKLKLEMEHLHEEKLQAIALDTEMLKTELESVHRKELIDMQEKINKKYHDDLETELKKMVADMDEKILKTTAKLNEEHMKELQQMKKELQEAFELQLSATEKELLSEKENELKILQQQYEEKIQQLHQIPSTQIKIWGSDSEIAKSCNAEEGDTLHQDQKEVLAVCENLEEPNASVEVVSANNNKKDTCNFLNSLQQELEKLKSEKEESSSKYEHVKEMLSELLKSYIAIEVSINKQLATLSVEETSDVVSSGVNNEEQVEENMSSAFENNTLCFLPDEDLEQELSRRLPGSIFDENGIDSTSKEIISSTSLNLQLAIKRLLSLLALTVQQCHESKVTQLELVNSAYEKGEEAAALQIKLDELQNQLLMEIEEKDHLTLELHKAAGMLNGYESEKSKWQLEIQKQEEIHHELIKKLGLYQEKINELEKNMKEQEEHLNHQRTLLADGLTDKEKLRTDVSEENQCTETQGLLTENSRLYESNKDLQQQSDKDRLQLSDNVRKLELAFEEQLATKEKLLEEQSHEIDDLHQQIEALEKQLKASKQFIQEQTFEREQERDESQSQIEKLHTMLREKERLQGAENRLIQEVEMLNDIVQKQSDALKNSVDKKNELEEMSRMMHDKITHLKNIVKNLENQVDIKAKNENSKTEEIENLKKILSETTQNNDELISELELLRSTSTSNEVTSHIHLLEEQLEVKTKELDSLNSSHSLLQELSFQMHKMEEKIEKRTKELEALQLSASSVSSPSSEDISLRDQLEAMKEIKNSDPHATTTSPLFEIRRLEDKLESLARAEEAAIKKTRDLEMLLKKQKHMEEELLQDKEALQQQVNNQLLQISSLQARVEEKRHNFDNAEATKKILRLQEVIDTRNESLEKKDKEVEDIRDKLDQTMKLLMAREEEISQLTSHQSKLDKTNEKNIEILKKENESLKIEVQQLQEEFNSLEIPTLTQAMLDEKNQEIDDLKQQLDDMVQQKKSYLQAELKDKELCDQTKKLAEDLHLKTAENESLQTALEASKTEIESLRIIATSKENECLEIEQKNQDLKRLNEIATQRKREIDSLRGVLKEKEELLEHVKTLQKELAELTDYQHKTEFEASKLKSLLTEKDKEIENLSQRLDLTVQNSTIKQNDLQHQIQSLQSQLNESIEILRHHSLSSDEITLESKKDMTVLLKENGKDISKMDKEENASNSETFHGECAREECLSLKINLANIQEKLMEKSEENQNLINKLLYLTEEKDTLLIKVHNLNHLREEIDSLKHQLQLKDNELKFHNEGTQIESIRNDIVEILEANLKSIQLLLSSNLGKKAEEDEMTFIKLFEGELKKTQDGLQQLHKDLVKFQGFSSNSNEGKENVVGEREDLEELEVNAILSRSEIDRLHDEIEQYQENLENLQNSLLNEKENNEKLREQYKLEIENLHEFYKQEILKLKPKNMISHLSSESDSAGDSSSILPQTGIVSEVKGLENISESELDSTSTVPEQINSLLNKVHKEGVEVLTLSELLFLRNHSSNSTQHMQLNWPTSLLALQQSWENEKHQLLEEIMALKELLSQATEATASLRSTGEATTELTNMLLKAVATVFQKERAITLAELRTHILSNNVNSPDDLRRLEDKLNEMDEHQKEVLGEVQNLIGKSYSAVNCDFEQILSKERLKYLQEREKLLSQINTLEEDFKTQGKSAKQKLELLECQLQQEQRFEDELRRSLDLEKKRTLDLTSQLSREKGMNANLEMSLALTRTELIKNQAAHDKDKREIQNLLVTCESERFRASALNQALESEQASFSQLQEAMEAEKRRAKSTCERQQQIIQELQNTLEHYKGKYSEVIATLDRERVNAINTYQELESLRAKTTTESSTKFTKSKLPGLPQMNNDFNQAMDLTAALEYERQQVLAISNMLSQERSIAAADLDRERTTSLHLKKNLDIMKDQNTNIRRELQQEKEHAVHLESERNQLQKQLQALKEQEMRKALDREVERELEREHQREIQLTLEQERQKQQDYKLDIKKLLQKIKLLEQHIQHLQDSEKQMKKKLELERDQNSRLNENKKSWSIVPSQSERSSELQKLESYRQQLNCILLKAHMELENILNRGAGDGMEYSFHQSIKPLLREINEIKLLLPNNHKGQHVSYFVEQVLNQNAELIGFVSKLCEDKMELRKYQTKLEDELAVRQQKEITFDQSLRFPSNATNEILVAERSAWAKERAALQLALHKAESKLLQLSSEMKSYRMNRSQEVFSTLGANKPDIKWQSLHMKYLRCESYRKALIYQKKYLLILLGGFQDTEAATLAMISQMGLLSSHAKKDGHEKSAILRFRSAAHVIIAISRMKFLVRRWQNAILSSSPLGSNQELSSRISQNTNCPSFSGEFPYQKIHLVGTTPPVKEAQFSRTPSEKSSASSTKRNILPLAIGSAPTSVDSELHLQQYIERMDSLHEHLNSSLSITRSDQH